MILLASAESGAPVALLDDAGALTDQRTAAVGADGPGKQELDPEILRRAALLLVDSRAQCEKLGELQHALGERERAMEIGEVTNGTAEANYLVALSQLQPGDEVALEIPNYLQLWGVPRSLGAKINPFHLRSDRNWEPDWDEFEQAVNKRTRLVYLSHPNNPTGSVLSLERTLQGLRHTRPAHRLDRRAAGAGRRLLVPARLPDHRPGQTLRSHGPHRREA